MKTKIAGGILTLLVAIFLAVYVWSSPHPVTDAAVNPNRLGAAKSGGLGKPLVQSSAASLQNGAPDQPTSLPQFADEGVKRAIQGDIWASSTASWHRHDQRSSRAFRIDAMRDWLRNPATRQIILAEAHSVFLSPRYAEFDESDIDASDKDVAVLAYVLLENVPHEGCKEAVKYVLDRWNSPELLSRLGGARYLAASLRYLTQEEVQQIPTAQVFSVLDGSDPALTEALFEELGSSSQSFVAELLRAYVAGAQDDSKKDYFSWIPVRIDFNRTDERSGRIDALKRQLALAQSERSSSYFEGMFWILDEVRELKATELLGDLQSFLGWLESTGRESYYLTSRVRDALEDLRRQ